MYQLVTEQDKGRMKRDTSLREVNHWRTLILANGESRLFTDSTTKGAFNRVLEIALRDNDRLFPSEASASELHQFVDVNFGYAGEKYIKYILNKVQCGLVGDISGTFRAALNKLTKAHGEDYLHEHLAHIAKLITGDAFAAEALFGESSATSYQNAYDAISEELLPRLPKKIDLDDARRAWQTLTHAILSRPTAFYDEKRDDKSMRLSTEIYGRIESEFEPGGDESVEEKQPVIKQVVIFPERVAAILTAAGFDAKKCMNDFIDRGWTPVAKDGRYPNKKWWGKPRRMIVIDGEKLYAESI